MPTLSCITYPADLPPLIPRPVEPYSRPSSPTISNAWDDLPPSTPESFYPTPPRSPEGPSPMEYDNDFRACFDVVNLADLRTTQLSLHRNRPYPISRFFRDRAIPAGSYARFSTSVIGSVLAYVRQKRIQDSNIDSSAYFRRFQPRVKRPLYYHDSDSDGSLPDLEPFDDPPHRTARQWRYVTRNPHVRHSSQGEATSPFVYERQQLFPANQARQQYVDDAFDKPAPRDRQNYS